MKFKYDKMRRLPSKEYSNSSAYVHSHVGVRSQKDSSLNMFFKIGSCHDIVEIHPVKNNNADNLSIDDIDDFVLKLSKIAEEATNMMENIKLNREDIKKFITNDITVEEIN